MKKVFFFSIILVSIIQSAFSQSQPSATILNGYYDAAVFNSTYQNEVYRNHFVRVISGSDTVNYFVDVYGRRALMIQGASGGSGGTVNVAAPISGDGSAMDPVTLSALSRDNAVWVWDSVGGNFAAGPDPYNKGMTVDAPLGNLSVTDGASTIGVPVIDIAPVQYVYGAAGLYSLAYPGGTYEIGLAQNGAQIGESLTWDGSIYVPKKTNSVLINKTAHGFRQGQPIIFNSGNWIKPTNDTTIAVYVVVDSISANSFLAAASGVYPTSISDGVYYQNGNTYSTIKDTVQTCLFSVADGKMIVNPILGFSSTSQDQNYGNVLWVSPYGNNATAQKGNFNLPYADPQAAVNNAASGDVVYLMPGTYLYGTGGFTVTNLAKQNTSMYFSPGAVIKNNDSSAQQLFKIDSAGVYAINGFGAIESGDADDVFLINNINAQVNINLERYFYQGGVSASNNFLKIDGVKKLYISVNNYIAINSRQYVFLMNNNQYPIGDTAAQIVFNIRNFEYNIKSVPAFGNGRTFCYFNGMQNTQLQINVDNCLYNSAYTNNAFIVVDIPNGFRKSSFSCNIQNGKFYSIKPDKTTDGLIFYRDTYAAVDSLNSFNFDCKNCEVQFPICYLRKVQNSTGNTCKINLSGNYSLTNRVPIYYEFSGGIDTADVSLNMKVTYPGYINGAIGGIDLYGAGSRAISGYYESLDTSIVLSYHSTPNNSSPNIFLTNCNLINKTGSVAPIKSNGPKVYQAAGIYCSNKYKDANTFFNQTGVWQTYTTKITNSDLILDAATLVSNPEYRIVINTDSGAGSDSDLAIPDAASQYEGAKIIVTSLDTSGAYGAKITTTGSVQIDPTTGSAVNSVSLSPNKAVTLYCVNTTGSTWNWVYSNN